MSDDHNYTYRGEIFHCRDAREHHLARMIARVRELGALVATAPDDLDAWQARSLVNRATDLAALAAELGDDFPRVPMYVDMLRMTSDLLIEVAHRTGMPLPEPARL